MAEAPKSDSSELDAEYLLMKRLYMRRKRAQYTGKSINTEALRLPPGRECKPRPKSHKRGKKGLFNSSRMESSREPKTVVADHAVSSPTPVGELDRDDEDESQNGPWSRKRLKKLPRLRNRLIEIGVDSQLASNSDIDFFHLSSLAQLMR